MYTRTYYCEERERERQREREAVDSHEYSVFHRYAFFAYGGACLCGCYKASLRRKQARANQASATEPFIMYVHLLFLCHKYIAEGPFIKLDINPINPGLCQLGGWEKS